MMIYKIMNKDGSKELRKNEYSNQSIYMMTNVDKKATCASLPIRCDSLDEARDIACKYIRSKKTVKSSDLKIIKVEVKETICEDNISILPKETDLYLLPYGWTENDFTDSAISFWRIMSTISDKFKAGVKPSLKYELRKDKDNYLYIHVSNIEYSL